MASVLVVGGGGRENAIAWKLSLSSNVRILLILNRSIKLSQYLFILNSHYSLSITYFNTLI